uniref:Uncharacterized protein n=1 Tax=Rhizophora mucronata TaxID=61149 RepID=A0A2P2N9Y7_RHIMU
MHIHGCICTIMSSKSWAAI